MKIFQKISIVIFSSIALQVWAGEKVDKSLPANSISNVSIENMRGRVTINGWDKAEVSVKGELDEKAERLIFEQDGSQILIKVVVPRHSQSGWNKSGSELTINMPNNVRMNFSGVSSDVDVSNLTKGSEVGTVSGNISAKNLQEHVELSTVSGNVISKNSSGKISLSSVSGNIRDRNSTGRLQLKVISGEIDAQSKANEVFANSVSGNIELSLDKVDELVLSTVSGDIESELALNANGEVKLSSVSGDLEMEFQDNVNASFRLNASAGGDLINKITSEKAQRAKYGPSSKLTFQTGSANSSVRASTVSGTVVVK